MCIYLPTLTSKKPRPTHKKNMNHNAHACMQCMHAASNLTRLRGDAVDTPARQKGHAVHSAVLEKLFPRGPAGQPRAPHKQTWRRKKRKQEKKKRKSRERYIGAGWSRSRKKKPCRSSIVFKAISGEQGSCCPKLEHTYIRNEKRCRVATGCRSNSSAISFTRPPAGKSTTSKHPNTCM